MYNETNTSRSEMVSIAIVEDDAVQAKCIEKYINSWACEKFAEVRACIFTSAENFLFEFEDNKDLNIILLDVMMHGMNGIELAKKVRKLDRGQSIIFITGAADYIAEGYEVEAINYLIKPVKKEKLFSCLTKALEKQNEQPPFIIISSNYEKVKIFCDEIIFVESIAHNLKIKTKNKTYITRMLLSDIEKMLGTTYFVKTHRAFIVNISLIRQIQKEFLFMEDGSKIPISRREYKNVNERFINYHIIKEQE